jgi:hypothetical protein
MRIDDRYDAVAIVHVNAAMTGTIARFALPLRTAASAIGSWDVLFMLSWGWEWSEIISV